MRVSLKFLVVVVISVSIFKVQALLSMDSHPPSRSLGQKIHFALGRDKQFRPNDKTPRQPTMLMSSTDASSLTLSKQNTTPHVPTANNATIETLEAAFSSHPFSHEKNEPHELDSTMSPDPSSSNNDENQRPLLEVPVHNFPSMWSCIEFLQQNLPKSPDTEWYYVVHYYASYCKVCQRVAMNYKKIALEYNRNHHKNHNKKIHFLKVDAGEWTQKKDGLENLRALGISKFPYVQIYDTRGICVASFSTGPSHLFSKRLRDTLDTILHRTPDEWNEFKQSYQTEIRQNMEFRKHLWSQHQQQPHHHHFLATESSQSE